MKGKWWLCVLCLVILTSTLIATPYSEAPVLSTLVARGELPPVEQRLPENPLVIQVYEMIGQYGGEIHVAALNPRGFGTDLHVTGFEPPLAFNLDATVGPNVIERWEYNADMTSVTLHLRKGMKWSDGVPFTADDMIFWWNDEVHNTELVAAVYIPEFEFSKLVKIDDYTVRMTFDKPYPNFDLTLANQWGYLGFWFRPAHFLKDFHPSYTDKAVLLARAQAEGYNTIRDYFYSRAGWSAKPIHPDTPTLIAYKLVEARPEYWVWERNPYYFKVDEAGNQLPYIDRIVVRRVESNETIQGMILSGQVDVEVWATTLDNYPLYRQNETVGGYRTLLWQTDRGSEVMYMLNQNVQDLGLRALFTDVRFRRALSVAINREEINDLLYFGRANIRQMTMLPNSKFFLPEWETAWAQYDPALANRLLDDMGLTKKDSEGFRLRPDGKRIAVTIEYWPEEPATKSPMSELIKDYWEAVGVQVALRPQDRSLNAQRAEANEIEVNVWHGGGTTDAAWPFAIGLVPGLPHKGISWGPEWGLWKTSRGEEGIEPPAEVKKLYELGDQFLAAETEEEKIALGQQIWQSQADNVWMIGTVGMAPYPVIVKSNLRNIPEQGIFSGDLLWLHGYNPEQFFLQQ